MMQLQQNEQNPTSQTVKPKVTITKPKQAFHEINKKVSPYIPTQNDSQDSKQDSSSSTIVFQSINYYPHRNRISAQFAKICSPFIKQKESKIILQNLSGSFKSGMNAIIGPSGCGKSTLLDILAHRKNKRDVTGRILVDGIVPPHEFKYMVGYVTQNDILCDTLTVRENLLFSANIRLPATIPYEKRSERVERIISEFGLESCANTRIGNEFLRGVSGGEKKRTAIGMEMVLSPKILFLDEPTGGLDAATSYKIMECLNNLAQKGHNIIFSIHQPRYSICKLFHTITLLCEGKMIYHGQGNQMVEYFSKYGYVCETHDNPADFVIDILINLMDEPIKFETLRHAYLESSMNKPDNDTFNEGNVDSSQKRAILESSKPAGSYFRESYYLSQRTLRTMFRNPALFLTQIIVDTILAFVIGLVFYDLKKTVDPGIPNRFSVLSLINLTQLVIAITGLEPLIRERVLLVQENLSGYYRISSFFMTKFIFDILITRFIVSVVFVCITYFMVGLERTAGSFFIFLLTIFLESLFGSILCLLIAASVDIFSLAAVVFILVSFMMTVFDGNIIALSSVFGWLAWMQWLSILRYANKMVMITEFRNINFCLENATNICPTSGTDVLTSRGFNFQTNWDVWQNIFAMFMMTIGIFIIAFIRTKFIKRKE